MLTVVSVAVVVRCLLTIIFASSVQFVVVEAAWIPRDNHCNHNNVLRIRQHTASVPFPNNMSKRPTAIEVDDDNERMTQYSQPRRNLMTQIGTTIFGGATCHVLIPTPMASAGEVGARITKAVTESEIGLSVRRSVVQGAQVMDGIDGKWEKFSDRFGLGSARQQQYKPVLRPIPPLQPLDPIVAATILNTCDATFQSLTKLSSQQLQQQIQKVSNIVGPSFLRSGFIESIWLSSLRFDGSSSNEIQTANQFNYLSYIHFKAYSDLFIERMTNSKNSIDFRTFKKDFERICGENLVSSLNPGWNQQQQTTNSNEKSLLLSLQAIDSFCQIMVTKGFIAQYDQSRIDPDDLSDWTTTSKSNNALLPNLSWTIAIDGDITLQSQILLQEQGLRLYPNNIRYATIAILGQQLSAGSNQFDITTDDYYMDTDYNSDPDKFEVKQVLININIDVP